MSGPASGPSSGLGVSGPALGPSSGPGVSGPTSGPSLGPDAPSSSSGPGHTATQEVTATTADVSDGSSSSLVADVVISALVCGVCLGAAGAFCLRRQRQAAAPMAPATAPDVTPVTAQDVTPVTAPEDTLSVEMAMAAVAAAPSAAVAAVAAAVTTTTSPAPAGDAEVSPVASIGGSVDSRDVDNKGTSG